MGVFFSLKHEDEDFVGENNFGIAYSSFFDFRQAFAEAQGVENYPTIATYRDPQNVIEQFLWLPDYTGEIEPALCRDLLGPMREFAKEEDIARCFVDLFQEAVERNLSVELT